MYSKSPLFLGGLGEENVATLFENLEKHKADLINCDHSQMAHTAQWLLERHGIEDAEYHKFLRELLKATIKSNEISIKREKGVYEGEPSILDGCLEHPPYPQPMEPRIYPVVPTATKERTVSDIIDLYVDECRATHVWKERTETEIISTFQLMRRIIGDKPVMQISRADIAEFKQTIMKLPPNMNKMPVYKGKTIAEIIRYADKHQKGRLSLVTVKKYLMRVNALFSFAESNGYIDTNPAQNVTINVKKSEKTIRAPFTDDDLYKLFNCKTVVEDEFRAPWQYWIIILAPFTGCRLEEMCQMHLSDIRQEEGIWVLDINEDIYNKKNLKSESSRRLVPVHPFLIDELNFIGFVDKLKKRGEKRLFPGLNLQSKGGFGRAVTRWFPKYREKAGIPKYDEKGHVKVFHSFRHTFDTRLKHQYVKTTMIDELMGHSVEKLSMGTYGAAYPVQQKLTDGIMKLDYDLAVFNTIKESKILKSLR